MKICLDCNNTKSENGLYCKKCGYKHRIRPTGLKYEVKIQNKGWIKKGNIPWNKGKMRGNYIGGYDAIHEWVERWYGKPEKCEKCNSKINVQWSNMSGKYFRDISDWQRLCKKCHCRYDFIKFNAREIFYV